ncbi:ATP synthase E chain-domain-containing protein [Halteromyces radiatus]|uniref:ATP synthase E chain-domain-containing protein n=1 Tax=Halteromyces radiatus TaxID=101107 RepID=UPI00221EA54F|nr:ATP synthase E chain-domain-containing protein [Halteromyces radiatus]KAI8097574.1 ATP synthase E chain-domain-containing protein [Halteromyces radiatus]
MVNQAFVNVGRWSALAFGLVYGYTHNISLNKQAEEQQKLAEYRHKESLIAQAKAAYAKQQLIKADPSPVAMELDFENPDFDFEKYLASVTIDEQ